MTMFVRVIDLAPESFAALKAETIAQIEAERAELTAAPRADEAQPIGLVTRAVRDVVAERTRQIEAEGWTPEHDDEHDTGSLAKAAACYALGRSTLRAPHSADVILWPWDSDSWKPNDPRRNLVKAGALILAELERLDRAAMQRAAQDDGKGEN